MKPFTPHLLTPAERGLSQVSAHWCATQDGDRDAYALFSRHYSCTNPHPKQRQFLGPGEKMVLISHDGQALIAYQRQTRRMDGQEGVNCTIFRNEGSTLSSLLLRESMDVAWGRWPGQRLFTFVNPMSVRSSNPGCCFAKAGWRKCGATQKGLIVMEVVP